MDEEKAKQFIINRACEYLKPDKSNKGYICPICGSGSGKNGTGITTRDNIHYTCWAGSCFTNSDIIDITKFEYKLEDYNEKLKKTAGIFNINIEENDNKNSLTSFRLNMNNKIPKKVTENVQETDFASFFSEESKNINETDYHRGLYIKIIKYFCLCYVKNWKHPKAPNSPFSPRLIVPNGKYGYLARDTRKSLSEKEKNIVKLE